MRKRCVVLIVALALVIFTGCQNKNVINRPLDNAKDELIMAIGSEPEGGFDPCIGWGRYGSPLFQSTLLETDHNMEIIKDLALDYIISQEGYIWTFNIRKDAKFTDGTAVSAEDIAFTFETAKNSGSIIDLTNMESVTSLDNYTVEFKLKRPDSTFAYTIAATGIVPKHIYDSNYGDNPIGSGPFKLVQWDKGQQIIMEANEDYYGEVPAMKKITILFMEEDAALAAAKSGQLDVAITNANLAGTKVNGMELKSLKTIDNRGITLPYLKENNRVTSDIAIRRALSYGIDRDKLVEQVINGYGRPAFTECDDMPWANSDSIVEHSLDKAKSILDEAGWITNKKGIREKDGIPAKFNILYSSSDSTRQALAMAVALQAEELGIKITVEGTSWDVISKKMNVDAVLMGWGVQDPTETYLLYHSNNMGKDYYNPELFSNKTVDKYIDSAMSALDINESLEYWKKVQWDGETGISTLGECPWVWLVNVDHLYYIRDGLDIGVQKIHPHGHAWPLVANLKSWQWKNN